MKALLRILAGAVIITVIFSGCGVVPTVPIMDRPEITHLLQNPDDPIGGKTMLAFCNVGFDREAVNEGVPENEYYWVPEFNIETETNELYELTRSLNLFDVILKSKLLPAETSRDAVIKEAWQRGFDFVLIPDIKNFRVLYKGHTGAHVGNIFLWFTLWVPSWWVHDELYGAEAEIEFSLVDVYSRSDIIKKAYIGTTELNLNAFQRGWKFFGVWRVPGGLNAENWQAVTNNLMPKAMNDLKIAYVKDFKNGIIKAVTKRDTFQRAVTKTVVMAVGINKYASSLISPVPFAADDARNFFNALQADKKAQEGYSELLLDGMAAKKDVLEKLAALGKRTRESDILVFYFSGYGASVLNAEGQTVPVLVPYDALPEKAGETGITFDELAAVLKDVGAGEIDIILDTAFSSNVTGKALVSAGEIAVSRIQDALGEKAAVYLACQANEPANVFGELKGGLFTYYFLEALSKGDSNQDGLVTAKEAFIYTQNKVKSTSQFRGKTQQPIWTGNAEARLILKGSDKEAAMEALMTQLGAETVEEIEME